MAQEEAQDTESDMQELPIERGFPIERVNEIAEKEGRAKMHYRPIYTMHKWWARRLGCVFRSICLYTLLDEDADISVLEVGAPEHPEAREKVQGDLSGNKALDRLIEAVSMEEPEPLWELYPKDVRVEDKRILDPFMGGGTSLVEASRFGAEVVGNDLNPVAWFVTKKQMEASEADLDKLEQAYDSLENEISDELTDLYKTPCPNGDHTADVMYYFWVKEVECVSCGATVPLFNDYRVGKGRYENKDKYNVYDPYGNAVIQVKDWQSECRSPATGQTFVPKQGNVSSGNYGCQNCGQKYGISKAIQEQDGFGLRLYAVEFYCPHCDDDDRPKSEVKSYKSAEDYDRELYQSAIDEWESSPELHDFVPDIDIPLGIMTDSSAFEGGIGGGHNLLDHGYDQWTDLFNTRQLLCLSKILRAIDQIDSKAEREFLLLTFSNILRTNTMMVGYDYSRNGVVNMFKSNSFDVPQEPIEGNPWGAKYGRGTFQSIWDMVTKGIEYSKAPTERYIQDGETVETPEFEKEVGGTFEVHSGDARTLNFDEKFDAIITDPPYYDNIIYSEISDFFYVWQRILLKDEYEVFEPTKTPRAESIVANPAEGKGEEEFESELAEAFDMMLQNLKDNGVLTFTYHHSDSKSWGELLEALCDVGFEVTATYPISADENKFIGGEAVEFDIIIVARPAGDRTPISWTNLRREIYRTARETRQRLEENRELSRGDIGVVEMGECFHEYSKHHGKVMRAGDTMNAKDVVDEIYGVIQHGSEIGEIDVYLELLETDDPSYNDLNKLTRGTKATPERMEDMKLYRMDGGEFILGTWEDEERLAYIQARTNGDDSELTALDKAQFLRYRYEKGKSIQNYLDKWGVDDRLRELAEGLADATGDDTYLRILGSSADPLRKTDMAEFGDED